MFADHLAFVDALQEALADEEVALTLVLDDLQHLAGSPRALEMVDHFLAWAPALLQGPARLTVDATAAAPEAASRWSARARQLRDLAFTHEETATAVGRWGLGLGPDAVAELHTLTQGWPAATRLAVLAVRAGARTDLRDVRRDEALADYLTTEVLGSLDPHLRDFVMEATDRRAGVPLPAGRRSLEHRLGCDARAVCQGRTVPQPRVGIGRRAVVPLARALRLEPALPPGGAADSGAGSRATGSPVVAHRRPRRRGHPRPVGARRRAGRRDRRVGVARPRPRRPERHRAKTGSCCSRRRDRRGRAAPGQGLRRGGAGGRRRGPAGARAGAGFSERLAQSARAQFEMRRRPSSSSSWSETARPCRSPSRAGTGWSPRPRRRCASGPRHDGTGQALRGHERGPDARPSPRGRAPAA